MYMEFEVTREHCCGPNGKSMTVRSEPLNDLWHPIAQAAKTALGAACNDTSCDGEKLRIEHKQHGGMIGALPECVHGNHVSIARRVMGPNGSNLKFEIKMEVSQP